MNRIEFIGASGAGKTTLFRDVLNERSNNDQWMTPEEARIALAKKEQIAGFKFNLRTVLLFCLKLNLMKKEHTTISNYLLRTYEDQLAFTRVADYHDVIDYSFRSLSVDESIDPYRKVKFMNYYTMLILHDFILVDELKDRPLIVYEEGILHNFSGLSELSDVTQLMTERPDLIKKLLPSGAVYCDLDLEENVNRRKKRLGSGQGTVFERQLDEEGLIALSKDSIKCAQAMIRLLESCDIPILYLNMMDAPDNNRALVKAFIKRFEG